MAEIVNLRLARKARQRGAAEADAAANRARHGRSKGEKAGQKAESTRLLRVIEGALRESD